MSAALFDKIVLGWILLGVALLPVQLFITPAYGRHMSAKWGPKIGNRPGWIAMELISPLILWAAFLYSGAALSAPALFFLAIWTGHYINRAIIFPLRTRTAGKHIPLLIVVFAIFFNGFNGWSNGTYLGSGRGGYDWHWFADPRFLAGLAVFVLGMGINTHSDNILLALRKPGETGYHIPQGGMFRFVSCPNYLGEIIEWAGFAIMCWNLPALGFAVWTAANLVPRAVAHHRWYREKFPDYPTGRRALVPGVL